MDKSSKLGRRGTGRNSGPSKILKREAIHAQIARQLMSELALDTKAGTLFQSQNEIAARFGVSPNTAREAVAKLVQEGLLERRFGSGTYVTDRRPQKYVGVLTELDFSHPQLSPFYPRLAQEVRRGLDAAGFETRLYMGHEPPFGAPSLDRITIPEFWSDLEADRLLGLVLVGVSPDLGEHALAGRDVALIDTSFIGNLPIVDYSCIVRLGVRYLAEHGRRRVACMSIGPAGTRDANQDAFLAEVQRYGLETCDDWVVSTPLTGSTADGVKAFRGIWSGSKGKPDGLLVLDDILYRDIAPLLLFNDINVPGDLMVVSHADPCDTRPLVPAPVGLSVDPRDVAAVIVRETASKLRGIPASTEGVPVPVKIVEPEAQELALTGA
jgi:DNA-binding LacI/PurR family transcriptional regulator